MCRKKLSLLKRTRISMIHFLLSRCNNHFGAIWICCPIKKGFPQRVFQKIYLPNFGHIRKTAIIGLSSCVIISFGACLADDMGLGKTIQLITYLLNIHARPDTDSPSLIVCPTSVLGNWQKEIERFAPTLSVHTHYGPIACKRRKL